MKNILATVILSTVVFFLVQAQTNVSGGIYSNTTWTLANSPYIVVDTMVVFPGVSLTIEPGVIVKFEAGKYIEIRQGHFIATGTATDSIVITSNSTTPTKGIYHGIVFNDPASITIDYCVFKYADRMIELTQLSLPSITIEHSSFYENNNCIPSANCQFHIAHTAFYSNNYCIGEFFNGVSNGFLDSCIFSNSQMGANINGYGYATNCTFNQNTYGLYINDFGNFTIDNCVFCNNTNGLFSFPHTLHRLRNSSFSQNQKAIQGHLTYMEGNILTDNNTALSMSIGSSDTIFNNYIFHNQIGLLTTGGMSANFYNNYICNNVYNINYTSSNNGSIAPICFCDTDSASIRSRIYDGYVNISRGLLDFMPFIYCDSSALAAIPPINCPAVATGIGEITLPSNSLMELFPNPSSDVINIYFEKSESKGTILISNMVGEAIFSSLIRGKKNTVDISSFANGIYIVEAIVGSQIIRKKFIKENSMR